MTFLKVPKVFVYGCLGPNAMAIFTGRMLDIVGKREQASYDQMLTWSDSLIWFSYTWIEDFIKVATIIRAAKIQCWISCNVQPFRLASWRQS